MRAEEPAALRRVKAEVRKHFGWVGRRPRVVVVVHSEVLEIVEYLSSRSVVGADSSLPRGWLPLTVHGVRLVDPTGHRWLVAWHRYPDPPTTAVRLEIA